MVTLKSDLEVTQVIRTGAIQKLGCGFLFAFYSSYGRICNRLWDILRQRMVWLWPWTRGQGSSKVIGNGIIW